MSRRLLVTSAVSCILAFAGPAAIAALPADWDGLTQVESSRLDGVFLRPGADFRTYTKVMLDPTEVAFEQNWQRDFNRNTVSLNQRISDADAERILEQARTGFENVFTRAFNDAGYQVVTTYGPDVLRVRTGVVNLRVTAPDQLNSSRSRTFSSNAGSATVIIEARDSLSGALLGRAVDTRSAGDNRPLVRNRVTNRADFERLAQVWARISVAGMNELRAMSPIPGGAPPT
jgi:hypothetical protein